MQARVKTRSTKICLIIHSLGIGGMERVMSELANNFSQRENVEVHLILIGRKRNVEYSLNKSIFVHKPSFKFNNNRRTLDTLRTIFFIRSKVKDINPDRVLSFGEMWNNLVLLSLIRSGYSVYISDRSVPDKDLGKLHNLLRDKLYPLASGYIAQTEEAKRVCVKKKWNKNVQIIGNPIRSIKNGEIDNKENIVLSVGRLIKTKHFDQLIRIFKMINLPGWKLVIVGGDAKNLTLSEELSLLVDKLNMQGKVLLEGRQQNVEGYYKKSKIFAFTSSSEGFPNVVGEALSAGLPVVAYDCVAGPSDMIEDGLNGFLVPLFDQDAFKRRLKLLMQSEELRTQYSKNSNFKIREFDKEDISDRFYNFITVKTESHEVAD